MAQIIIDINDAKVTAQNYAAFVATHPEPEGYDSSGPAAKLAHVKDTLVKLMNHAVKRGRQQLDTQAAALAVADVDMTA